jgi:hypothetical protein
MSFGMMWLGIFIVSNFFTALCLYGAIYDKLHLYSLIRYVVFWPGMLYYDYKRSHPGIMKHKSTLKKFIKYHFNEKEWGRWMD